MPGAESGAGSGDEITYDWPDGGGAPFDTTDDATRWVLVAGSRFGRTWPAGSFLDFGSWETDFEKRVPMGYMGIAVAERLALVSHGEVVHEWPGTAHEPGPTTTYTVVDGQGGRRAPDGTWITHDHDTYDDAVAEALGMDDRRALVVRFLISRDWH